MNRNLSRCVKVLGAFTFAIGDWVEVLHGHGLGAYPIPVGTVGVIEDIYLHDANGHHDPELVPNPDHNDVWIYDVSFGDMLDGGEGARFFADELRAHHGPTTQ